MREAYKRYLVILLMLIMTFNFVDRVALGLVLQEIKTDLRLTDTELGFLTGIAFALFYSVMGVPIARWADRGNRVLIISATAALWSVAVAACGLAGTFVQLMLIRVGVGVGEAGCYAPGLSLISGYFSRSERPRAVAIYGLGAPLSAVVGYLLAGWVNELYGWRAMFIVLGIPGLILGTIAWFTLKEPRVSAKYDDATAATTLGNRATQLSDPLRPSTLREVGIALWANATFRHLFFGLAVMFFFIYGIVQWQPTFFIRSYGLTTGQIGSWFAGVYGIGGMLGTYLGGELATRYAAGRERVQLVASAIALTGCGLLSAAVYLSPNRYVALGLMTGVSVILAAVNAPLYATLQTLVPERMRAVSIALVLLFANLIGMGLGPLAAGALSDALRPWAHDESLRYSLLILAPGYFWVAWHVQRASKTVLLDLERADPTTANLNLSQTPQNTASPVWSDV